MLGNIIILFIYTTITEYYNVIRYFHILFNGHLLKQSRMGYGVTKYDLSKQQPINLDSASCKRIPEFFQRTPLFQFMKTRSEHIHRGQNKRKKQTREKISSRIIDECSMRRTRLLVRQSYVSPTFRHRSVYICVSNVYVFGNTWREEETHDSSSSWLLIISQRQQR